MSAWQVNLKTCTGSAGGSQESGGLGGVGNVGFRVLGRRLGTGRAPRPRRKVYWQLRACGAYDDLKLVPTFELETGGPTSQRMQE